MQRLLCWPTRSTLMNEGLVSGDNWVTPNGGKWVFDAKERMAHVYDNRWYQQFAMSADVACAFPIRVSKGLADATRE